MKKICDNELIEETIRRECGATVVDFITSEVDFSLKRSVHLSLKDGSVQQSPDAGLQNTYIELRKLNDIRDLNKHLHQVNRKLPDAGIYIGCFEGYQERKTRFRARYPKSLFKALWLSDFILNRVLPKLSSTKRIYAFLSRKKYPVISKAEALGRIVYAGFEIVGCESIDNLIYFSVIKTKEPALSKASSGDLFFRLKRVSKGGKIIGIYKVRTMHPYSEYLQDYVVKMNGYNKTGKPNNDFRLTSWGKLIRKLYLDEIPQLINVVKGDICLVGVRPISQSGYKALPPDLQVDRIKYKPGCIPPNVSLGITGFSGVIRAERLYLKHKQNHGYLTNFRFFWMAMYNIISKKCFSA